MGFQAAVMRSILITSAFRAKDKAIEK